MQKATLVLTLLSSFPASRGAGAAEPPRSPQGGTQPNCIVQNFDFVTAPALPNGWLAFNTAGSGPVWATSTFLPDTAPNKAAVSVPGVVSDKGLVSEEFTITANQTELVFRHAYAFDEGLDGGILEISVGGGPFEKLSSGIHGEWAQGDPATPITAPDNPLGAGKAWSGDSGGYVTSVYRFDPFAAAGPVGETVRMRWRMGSDGTGAGTGFWWIDTVSVTQPCALPDSIVVDERSSTDVVAGAALNGVLEPNEAAVLEPSRFDGWDANLLLTATASFSGPAGADYTILDSAADYGALVPGSVADCYSATNDCYVVYVDESPSRPAPHWDATLAEQASEGSYVRWRLHIGDSFADAPTSHPFYRFIENVFHNGVTGGCGGGTYCPSNGTLRKQMAVFVLKARFDALYQPPPCTGVFTDVACPGPFTDWIEDLYARGIVAGCGSGPTYCPDATVTRQQMAVFLLKTLEGSSYAPPACAGTFADVPCSNPFAAWIEDLANRQITGGCGGGNYCPGNATTRGQMAPFLVKTFGLRLYGP